MRTHCLFGVHCLSRVLASFVCSGVLEDSLPCRTMLCKNPAPVLWMVQMVLAVCSTVCWSFGTAPPPPLPRPHGWTSAFRSASSSSSSSTPSTTTKSCTTKQMATALIDLLVPLAVKVNIDQTNVTLAQYQALEKAVWRSVVVQAKHQQQQEQHEIIISNAQEEEEAVLEEESSLVEEPILAVEEEATPDVIQSLPADEEEKAGVMEEKVDLPVHEQDVSLDAVEEAEVGDNNNEEAPSRFFPSIISKSFGKPLDVIKSIATPSIPRQEEKEVLSNSITENSETVDKQQEEVKSVVVEEKEEPPAVEDEIEDGIMAESNEEEPEAATEESKQEDSNKEAVEEVASVDDKPDEPVSSIVAEEESTEVDSAVDDIVADTNPTSLEEPAAKEPSDLETKKIDPLVELFATPRTPLVSTLYAPTFMTEEQIQQARKSPKSPQEQARLTARYAAIADVGDRAFCILVDLGMIGDSTNYTSRFDQFWELLEESEEVSPQPVGGASSSSAASSSTSSTQLSMLGDQREGETPLPPPVATRLSMMVSPLVQRLSQRVLANIQNKWDWVLNRVAVGIWRRRSTRPAWVQRRLAAKYAALADPQDRAAAVLNDLGI